MKKIIIVSTIFYLFYYSSITAIDTLDCPNKLPNKMSCIKGGIFTIGSSSNTWKDEQPEHKLYLSTFLIDQYEVTTLEYQQCVAEKKCSPTISNYKQLRGEQQPQVKATWFQARDYCQAYNKRLPTEAEFEAASRGPNGDIYPWGNEKATCDRAVIYDGPGRGCSKDFGEQGTTNVVGSKPIGRYNLYDMAGNAHEWVNDWFEKDYAKCGQACLGSNPRGPCDGKDTCLGYTERVVKGGSWYWNWDWARASKRRAYRPDNNPPHHFGFRCAKNVE